MFCNKCGTELPDNSIYCPQCGKKVVYPESAPEPAPKKPKRTAAIAAVVAVAIIAAVGIGLWWKADQDAAQAAWELAHTTQITKVSVEAPAFDIAATPIPVQVHGIDLDGNTVDELRFLKPDSMQVETLAGSYDISFPAGYITNEGKVYKSPEVTQHVEVAQPTNADSADQAQPAGQDGAPTSGEVKPAGSDTSQTTAQSGTSDEVKPVGQVIQAGTYEEVNDLEVTDELINQITDLAKQDTEDNGKAEDLKKKASDNHQAAVKAEEDRIAAEKEAERKAAREAEITGWATDWLTNMYDNYDKDTNSYIRKSFNYPSTFAPNAEQPNGIGWYRNVLHHFNYVTAVDENTVEYSIEYEFGGPSGNNWDTKTATGTLVYNDDGLITAWRPSNF